MNMDTQGPESGSSDADWVAYGDPHRIDGNEALRPDAPMPGWVESLGRRLERAIHGAVMLEQHEYLEDRRLLHSVRTWEVKTVPWLLEDGYILAMTDFPVATDTCCVVAFTPIYADGRTAMDSTTVAAAMSLEVVDYEVFTYQERGRTAFENTRMMLHSAYVAELRRQAFALKLQYIQFLYFTRLVPRVREAFEDPNGHLDAFLARRPRQPDEARSRAKAPTPVQPTPVRESPADLTSFIRPTPVREDAP